MKSSPKRTSPKKSSPGYIVSELSHDPRSEILEYLPENIKLGYPYKDVYVNKLKTETRNAIKTMNKFLKEITNLSKNKNWIFEIKQDHFLLNLEFDGDVEKLLDIFKYQNDKKSKYMETFELTPNTIIEFQYTRKKKNNKYLKNKGLLKLKVSGDKYIVNALNNQNLILNLLE